MWKVCHCYVNRRGSCVHPYLQDRYNELHSASHSFSSGDAKWAIVGVKGVCSSIISVRTCINTFIHRGSVVRLFFCLLACRINGSVDKAVSTQKWLSTHYQTLDVLKNATRQYAADNTSPEFVHIQALLVMDCHPHLLWCLLCLNSSLLPEANFHVPAVRVTALPWQPRSCLRQSLNKKRCHVYSFPDRTAHHPTDRRMDILQRGCQ